MKRFLVFRGDTYYPSGGWADFYGQYATETEAIVASKEGTKTDWFQIIDTDDPPSPEDV